MYNCLQLLNAYKTKLKMLEETIMVIWSKNHEKFPVCAITCSGETFHITVLLNVLYTVYVKGCFTTSCILIKI